ncbi:pilus assembly protein CpaF [Paenibacillus sp. LS1]|uniref:pilus assembly protein CpaF n=1 Tax=Paenibacillus sp. LS1 TaxID=2992120 RepID=UPI0022324BA6|nr:pilus assembly protein CpaF [Paenibacillus sp. LS1]MCW3793940.1 pilus assembly protein CpaF [Paenibacillus sp. LS1]
MPSPQAVNIFVIVIITLLGAYFLYHKFTEKKGVTHKVDPKIAKYSLIKIREYILETFNKFTNVDLNDMRLTDEEYSRLKSKRLELKSALKGCSNGDLNDKTYVKTFIYDALNKTYDLNETNINLVIPFDNRKKLSIQDKFEILLFKYKKKYGFDALTRLILDHNLDELKSEIENGETESYIINEQEISDIFNYEYKNLTFDEKLQIIVQRVYQNMKGFGVIDEIRDMRIDGVSGGVSGIPESFMHVVGDYDSYSQQLKPSTEPKASDSVWIFFGGKLINLAFLSFGSEHELRRVGQTIYKHNNPGQLSESNGYKVNDMKDGSRVVVVRPKLAETWAFFVRKFDSNISTLETIITDKNAQLPINLLMFLTKGERITAITGPQGSGKTTMLMAMIKHIYGWHSLRVQEMAFELRLRKIYSQRNILSFRETDTVSGQEGLDLQKKTDGAVNILGEVASDPVAAWMIQMGQVASLFTLFTHHGKTFNDLVFSLRNSLLKQNIFNNERIAQEQVMQVINFDIHLRKDFDGHRYIERITETGTDLDAKELGSNVIEYKDGEYVVGSALSEKSISEMKDRMTPSDAEKFSAFLKENWG